MTVNPYEGADIVVLLSRPPHEGLILTIPRGGKVPASFIVVGGQLTDEMREIVIRTLAGILTMAEVPDAATAAQDELSRMEDAIYTDKETGFLVLAVTAWTSDAGLIALSRGTLES
jgi:hypothetical protein